MTSEESTYPRPSAQIVVKALEAFGIRDVVVSPGTRDTPLLLACDASQSLRVRAVIDERSAAFFALGMADALHRPVALVCTSGTAMLNYAPALAEAYYRHIPLIALTADRPLQWIDQSDSQTMRQHNALDAIVKKSFEIPDIAPDDVAMMDFASRIACDALAVALRTPQGPVHINMPFDLPLGLQFPEIKALRLPRVVGKAPALSVQQIKQLSEESAGKRILVVCGTMPPDNRLNKALNRLAAIPGVVVMAELTANLHGKKIITNTDATLAAVKALGSDHRPDLVIVCGGALVSGILKKYLRSLKGCPQWYVAPYSDALQDTFRNLTLAVESTPENFFPSFASLLARHNAAAGDSLFTSLWHNASETARQDFARYCDDAPWSEMKALSLIVPQIPDSFNLHASNGTAVRYLLLNASDRFHSFSCNRGVSGIEGATSTAIGASVCYSRPTLLITGDMSCSYDIGALALSGIPSNFKMIVLSNSGGGIFRVIGKTSGLPIRENLLCVPPRLPLEALARAYGFRYCSADSADSLLSVLKPFLCDDSASAILDIKVDAETSAEVFRKYNTLLTTD